MMCPNKCRSPMGVREELRRSVLPAPSDREHQAQQLDGCAVEVGLPASLNAMLADAHALAEGPMNGVRSSSGLPSTRRRSARALSSMTPRVAARAMRFPSTRPLAFSRRASGVPSKTWTLVISVEDTDPASNMALALGSVNRGRVVLGALEVASVDKTSIRDFRVGDMRATGRPRSALMGCGDGWKCSLMAIDVRAAPPL